MTSTSPLDHVTDLYLPAEDPGAGIFFPGNQPVTPKMIGACIALVEKAKKKRVSDSKVAEGGVPFRSHFMPTSGGDMYIFRKMPTEILSMSKLGMPAVVANQLLSERMIKGGLIIVSGLPGNGKSTTLASIIVARLEKYAGICITVEDPIEMPLQGRHGDGLCLQRGVIGEEQFATAIRDAMRAYPAKTPAMMMIGEVRDSETAALAIRSAVDGRLVMITMHAANPIKALMRLCSFASRHMPLEEVRELLASSFRMALHQTLASVPGTDQVKLQLQVLQDTNSVAGTIRSRNLSLETLKNDLTQQTNCLRLKLPIELRSVD